MEKIIERQLPDCAIICIYRKHLDESLIIFCKKSNELSIRSAAQPMPWAMNAIL